MTVVREGAGAPPSMMSAPERAVPRLAHNPALDGVRGAAVLAVLVFHTGLVDGGWIGVEVFFVLSGYLITALMCAEQSATGTVRLGEFYRRRARRLLPGLGALVLVTGAFALFVAGPTEQRAIRRDVLGALTYSSNWINIFRETDYWDKFALPSPLQHVWSLAVEEQFYVLYPLLVIVLLRRRVRMEVVLPALALVALALQLGLLAAGGGINRIYQGTDTRAFGLLAGATLAVIRLPRLGRAAATAVGTVCGVGLLVAAIWLDGAHRDTYAGPFQLVTMASVGLLLVCVQAPATVITRLLSARWLTRAGVLSYGIYLFHWPLLQTVDRTWDLGVVPRTVLVLIASVAVAEASFRLLESPLRHRGLAAWPRRWAPPVAYVAVAVLAIAVTVPRAEDPVSASDVAGEVVPSNDGSTAAIGDDGLLERPVDRPFRLLIVGDSVGDSIVASFQALAPQLGVEVFSRAAPSCSYDRERTQESGPDDLEPETCVAIVEGWRADVDAYRPDAVLFMYGSWTSWYYQDAYRSQCDAVMRDHVVDLYERAVADLTSAGAPVYFVLPSYWRLNGATSADPDYDCARRNMLDFAASDDDLVVAVDPHPLVCQGYDCDATVSGSAVRPDGLHFAGPGGEKVATYLAAAMFAPPPGGWPEQPGVVFG